MLFRDVVVARCENRAMRAVATAGGVATREAAASSSQLRLVPELGPSLRVVGLFAGIGGIEMGLAQAGHRTALLCEIDPAARLVLAQHAGSRPIRGDVRRMRTLPQCDVVAAGFPCQDLSQAGRTAGIGGENSGLVQRVFELLQASNHRPTWLLMENVPFMLQLDRGRAMDYLTTTLEELGYRWAYRIVDTRAFGLPQRRQRVILLASKTEDPRAVLFVGNHTEPDWGDAHEQACGFYWTEGVRGLGWAVDAIPTLKGGSTIGIPSPPAIRMPNGTIVIPDIRDAERLQGFDPDWTRPADAASGRKGARWKLIGNAVSVPVARWVGGRLRDRRPYASHEDASLRSGQPWPRAAWGEHGRRKVAPFTPWPVLEQYQHLAEFLQYPTSPLSFRATAGFFARTERSTLNFPPGFIAAVRAHLERMRDSDSKN
jgi:DNA (cytosine-5)-methyltransferase 1